MLYAFPMDFVMFFVYLIGFAGAACILFSPPLIRIYKALEERGY